jgi:hypothetical protein
MTIVIRASSTSLWPDCSRRQAARMFPIQIREQGYELREIPSSVGASVGTGTHSAVAACMETKMVSGELGNAVENEQAGLASLEEEVKRGVRWDQTTRDLNTAQKQVIRMYRTYRLHVAPDIQPRAVERRLNFTTKRGNTVSGAVDATDAGMHDLKTGVMRRSNIAQYGTYSLLGRAAGETVDHIIEDYIPRVDIDKPQPVPEQIVYDPKMAERVAVRIILDVETKYDEFIESGDNMVFMANPNSNLCGDRFCPAWGTSFCEEWRRA